VTIFDRPGAAGDPPAGTVVVSGEITDGEAVRAAMPAGTEAIVHLASMVSAECEVDPDRAVRVNVGGLGVVLDAARGLSAPPRLLFTSSVAVFGRSGGVAAGDDSKQAPVTTYGMTKAVGELLVNEHTRRGWIDGRTARLPTVIIRPGRPNAAASSFASGLFREPLAGLDAVVPVDPSTPIVVTGHRTAVRGLAGLLALDGARLGAGDRAYSLPGLETTVQEMITACRARPESTGALSVEPDPLIQSVVGSWPARWSAIRAEGLGLPADRDLDAIIEHYLADFA
jgi:nucleoside-diphosphate-sugar epimerase